MGIHVKTDTGLVALQSHVKTATGLVPMSLHVKTATGIVALSGADISAKQLMVLGDSTIAAYLGQNSVKEYLDGIDPTTVIDFSVPGETISQQRARFNSYVSGSTVDAVVIVQVGLNNLSTVESTAVTLSQYQAMVDDIVAAGGLPVLCTMTPCRQRLIDVYGGTNGQLSYQKWIDMNAAILGDGATPIHGGVVSVSSHTAALNDGVGNLRVQYDMGDHIHENNAARRIVAAAWSAAMAHIGYRYVEKVVFTSGELAGAIAESSGAGQVIYTATAMSASTPIAFSLAPVGDHAEFTINASTGAVTLTADPDYESKSSYAFTVIATDAASNAAEQAVTLAITDVVEQTPLEALFTGQAGILVDSVDAAVSAGLVWQDAAGTVPATAAGHPVGKITDGSGNGNHLTQSTSTARPVLTSYGGKLWLEFDGINNCLSTASIDFSASDEMSVVVGQRKTGSAVAILAELGNFSQRGFSIAAPESASLNYTYFCRGDNTAITTQAATMSSGAAPDTAVISGTGSISGDISKIWRNGVAGIDGTGEKGPGTFGNLPLFIGSRNNASLRYKGLVQTIFVRGGTRLTDTERQAAEQYVAGRIGITIA